MSRDTLAPIRVSGCSLNDWLKGLASGDQCRLTGSGNTLKVLSDDVLYKYKFPLLYCAASVAQIYVL